jgi:hypothetical protein
MIAELAEKVFSNAKYGTNHHIDRENFAVFCFASEIKVVNKRCGCHSFSTCNHPNLEKINRLKDGL